MSTNSRLKRQLTALTGAALLAITIAACGDDSSPTAPTAVGDAQGTSPVVPGGLAGGAGTDLAGGDGADAKGGGGGGGNKVDVCHITGNGGVNQLNVSVNALPAHRGHGDAIPGELVPGSSTLVFDASCASVTFGLDIEKSTEGQDADAAPGPSLLVGDPVNWAYVVTNTGGGTLINVEVADDQGVAVSCPQTTLAAGASMTCSAAGVVVANQYANTGTVTGLTKGVDGDEAHLIESDQGHPSDSDQSHYFGVGPGISIDKTTSDGVGGFADGPTLTAGDPVSWRYVVSNTGNVDLTAVAVTDDQGVTVTCGQTTLAVGETITCDAPGTVGTSPYTNIGTATAMTPVNGSVTASDASNYLVFVPDPSIDIEKATEGEDADTGTGPSLLVGSTVNWTYVVTNDGNVDLTNVSVTDSQNVQVSCNSSSLAVGASMTCTGSGSATIGQYENIGTATGDSLFGAVTDSDPSHYLGTETGNTHPGVQIETATNGVDADSAPGPQVTEGTTVNWSYAVTNLGQEELTNVVVTDDQGQLPDCGGQTTLGAAATMTCTASDTAILGAYQTIGRVTADTVGGAASDSDPTHYTGVAAGVPSIGIEKTTNGQDADTVGSGPTISAGATVNWAYAVTNTGDLPLFPVVVTDSDLSLTLDCTALDADGPLLPGQTRSCTASGLAVDTSGLPNGDYENTGTATGTPTDTQGVPTGGPNVVASDLSHYTGETAGSSGIDLETFTEDQTGALHDADTGAGPSLSIGDVVGWEYVVRNTGTIALENITVTASLGSAVSCLDASGNQVNGSAVLVSGGELRCSSSGTVANGLNTNSGNVTSDEFGASTTPATDADASNYTGVAPAASIDIEKDTNGSDADAAPGPTLAKDDPITWRYVVTNDGAAALSGVTVTDNDGSLVVNCAIPANPGGIPDPFPSGSSFICEATGIATVGQYENIGTASGDAANGTVTDSDRSHYFVPLPATAAIALEKSTNGADADGPTDPDVPQISQGDQVTWTYAVTNTGGVNLVNVVVTDDQLGTVCTLTGGGTTTPGFLAPNDTASCTATGSAVVTAGFPGGVYANTGTVTGDPQAGGAAVSDTDSSHYQGLGPVTVDIEKATNGNDADTTPVTVTVGDPVTWSYVVTNTSAEDLLNIVVTDDREGGVTCPQSTLASGASMTCTPITKNAVEGVYINVASVNAQALDGRTAFDSDPSQYVGQPVVPVTDVDIEKATNGQDADVAPGPSLDVGTSVDWTYLVTNTGNTSIGFGSGQVIVVTDDQGETVSCPSSTLAPLESMTCTASGIVGIGPYANVGTVEVRTGSQAGPIVASDTDASHYTGVGSPGIDIEKSTNGVDADTPASAVGILLGTPVTWEYVVTNTGAVPLNNITVTDDQLGSVSCPQTTLGVGAAPMTCTANGFAVDTSGLPGGVYANIGTATADAAGGGGADGRTTVTDSDPSHYDNSL